MSMRAAKGKKRQAPIATVAAATLLLLVVLLALPAGAALPRSVDVADLAPFKSPVAHIAPAPTLVAASILPETSAITPRAGPARARLRVHLASPPSWPFSPARVGTFGRPELKTRVRGFDFGLSEQHQGNQWFRPGFVVGVHNGPSQYQFAGYSPANYGDPLGLCVGGLRDTGLCKGVNRLMAPKETIHVKNLRVERDLYWAKLEAIRVVGGWIRSPRVTHRIFPNLHQGPMEPINGLVVHQTTADNAMSTFHTYAEAGRKVGAHLLIKRDGSIVQTSLVNQQAYHVGVMKSRCIHEPEFCSAPDSNIFFAMMPLAAEYQRSLAKKAEGDRDLSSYEKDKRFPYRYLANADSIGIEAVGASRHPLTTIYPYWGDDAVFDDATEAQNASLKWLVRQLRRVYGLPDGRVHYHPDIAEKNPGESRSLRWE